MFGNTHELSSASRNHMVQMSIAHQEHEVELKQPHRASSAVRKLSDVLQCQTYSIARCKAVLTCKPKQASLPVRMVSSQLLQLQDQMSAAQFKVRLLGADGNHRLLHYAQCFDKGMLRQVAVRQLLTSVISSCFDVINVSLWHATSQIVWLTEVCKLLWSPYFLLPQCSCMLSIVWVKLAQESC